MIIGVPSLAAPGELSCWLRNHAAFLSFVQSSPPHSATIVLMPPGCSRGWGCPLCTPCSAQAPPVLPTRHRAQGTSPVLLRVTVVPCVKGRVWLQLSTGRPLNSLRLLITCSIATASAREWTGSRKALSELEGDRKPILQRDVGFWCSASF